MQFSVQPKFLYIWSIVDLLSLEAKEGGMLICHCDKMSEENKGGILVHSF